MLIVVKKQEAKAAQRDVVVEVDADVVDGVATITNSRDPVTVGAWRDLGYPVDTPGSYVLVGAYDGVRSLVQPVPLPSEPDWLAREQAVVDRVTAVYATQIADRDALIVALTAERDRNAADATEKIEIRDRAIVELTNALGVASATLVATRKALGVVDVAADPLVAAEATVRG